MVKRNIFLLFFFFSCSLYAQEKNSVQGFSQSPSDIQYYFSTPLTFKEITHMQQRVYAQIQNLQKSNNRTREENVALLKHGQLLGFLYPAIDDEKMQKAVVEVLLSVRDEFLSYSAKNRKDYKIKTELVFLIHAGALVYLQDDTYQFTRIISRLASEVYNKAPNPKVALALGQWYIGSNKTHSLLINNSLAKKYLNVALELDEESSYISYLAYIYLSNLYFKTRNGDKVRKYMGKAKALYPDGSFAYLVNELFFANGKTVF